MKFLGKMSVFITFLQTFSGVPSPFGLSRFSGRELNLLVKCIEYHTTERGSTASKSCRVTCEDNIQACRKMTFVMHSLSIGDTFLVRSLFLMRLLRFSAGLLCCHQAVTENWHTHELFPIYSRPSYVYISKTCFRVIDDKSLQESEHRQPSYVY